MPKGFYKSYLEAVPLPAVLVDAEARILAGNEAAVKLNPHADNDRPLILVFRQPSLNSAVDDCLRDGKSHKAIYAHSDGPQEHRFDATVSPVDLASVSRGQAAPAASKGVMICFQDVTEVQQLDQMRREFVSNVSHELRTPLTAILGFVETLQGPARNDPKASERFLGIMSDEANRMNRLVGDLLSLSRVEEVSRMRPTDPVDLDQIIRAVIRNLSSVSEASASTVSYAEQLSTATVSGDADQLLQVVTNLVENALKYGGENTHVEISLECVSGRGGLKGDGYKIAVKDNGPGIDHIHIARLTERFYRIDSHRSREMGGTGLGLAIVKHIINRHRGRLKIESALGKGSVFSVILPVV
ncbi:ATP-binding protein [Shimia sagamensis]|uniref:histidine kinase n=1 Tax=Shimia sagamensis TaxID=1566352 RepID=A0ABY1NHM7_9RHOB|nr:ATP-binding protein [Shimia sagamensis]SMP09895.1 two-component system, OmpR family, phosphate regulon sensor histidine kinase PhoR [Shimia sagamensis]